MKFQDIVKWNKRVSALYAFGIWTMISSFAYFKYTGRYEDIPVKEEKDDSDTDEKNIYQTAHSKTVIIYKKDFVPYTTRIYNFIQSFREPGPGEGDE